MMFRKNFIILLFLTIIISMGIVSASENIDVALTDNSENMDLELDQNYLADSSEMDSSSDSSENLNLELDPNYLADSSEIDSSSDNSYVAFVSNTTSSNTGNGSYENPFSSINIAHDNIDGYKDSITLNIFEGIYYLDSDLKFNTSNLIIKSVSGNVIFKNLDNIEGTPSNPGSQIAFGLIPDNANFTIENIIFDANDWTLTNGEYEYFSPFKGDNANVIFNNCSFTGYNGKLALLYTTDNNVNYTFNSCRFVNFENTRNLVPGTDTCIYTFNFCIFEPSTFTKGIGMTQSKEAIFDGCWFGQNTNYCAFFYNMKTGKIRSEKYEFVKYAVFNISENYLGNNQYEIIGKLVWNGTDDNEGIDKLGPMTVTLSSSSGNLPETAILQDGVFRVIYNSTASTHDVTAKLDNEIITLIFNATDMTVNTSDIIIGQDQNITVTLPQDFNGTLSIKVNNKTYNTTVDNTNSITYKIPDVLPAGKHVIDVIFADEKNHIYGFNSTNITVSKVSNYDFNATVTPTVYLGDNATVTLSLPSGAAGNVTVKVGDNEAKTFNVNDVISIDGFIAGDNVVNITFISDMYDAKSVVKTVVASPKPTTITTVNVTTTYNVAKDLVITLTDVNGNVLANKTVNVVVGTINNDLTTNASGQVSMDISTLAPNTYVANIAFAGDEVYAKSNATANVVVNKIASSLAAPAVTATYDVAKNLVITLTANGKALANQKVTVKVGSISKTLTTDAKGQVSVDVSKLTPKTYTATFTYAGDDINDKSSNTAKVVVNKAKPKITAKKATFKAKKKTKKYSIVLKDNKGKAIKKAKVTLKVKGKTYKATTNTKGKATFKITKLTKKGKPTATIKFGGNTLYKAVSKKVKLTIKK